MSSLVAQRVKHLPAMQETWVRSLVREVPLEKEMATHSSILAWRIPWIEEPGGLQSIGSRRVGHDWASSLHFTSMSYLQSFYKQSRLENKNYLPFTWFWKPHQRLTEHLTVFWPRFISVFEIPDSDLGKEAIPSLLPRKTLLKLVSYLCLYNNI